MTQEIIDEINNNTHLRELSIEARKYLNTLDGIKILSPGEAVNLMKKYISGENVDFSNFDIVFYSLYWNALDLRKIRKIAPENMQQKLTAETLLRNNTESLLS